MFHIQLLFATAEVRRKFFQFNNPMRLKTRLICFGRDFEIKRIRRFRSRFYRTLVYSWSRIILIISSSERFDVWGVVDTSFICSSHYNQGIHSSNGIRVFFCFRFLSSLVCDKIRFQAKLKIRKKETANSKCVKLSAFRSALTNMLGYLAVFSLRIKKLSRRGPLPRPIIKKIKTVP